VLRFVVSSRGALKKNYLLKYVGERGRCGEKEKEADYAAFVRERGRISVSKAVMSESQDALTG